MTDKLKYKKDYIRTGSYHGYAPPNHERLDLTGPVAYELRETFDFSTKLSPNHPNHNLHQESKFQTTLLELRKECVPFALKILKLFARALGESENYFVERSKSISDPDIPTYTTFRTIYYPKITKDVEFEPGLIRCGEHTDYGILTLLFQDEIGGLEVKTVHNTWVPATPIAGSILINTGDLLEFWSGGQFPATTHRVLVPEIEMKKRIPRQSIAFFIHADDNEIVSPLKTSKNTIFEPISAYEHAKRKLEATYY